MDLNQTSMLTTPQKLPGDPEELAMIENLENELNTLADCLEKSNEKVRMQNRKIQEQADLLANTNQENYQLQEENARLRTLIDTYMRNFSCFTTELRKTTDLEKENLTLQQKLEAITIESSEKIIDLELEKDRLQKEVESLQAKNKTAQEELNTLKKDFNNFNKLIKESFEKTLTYKHTVEIEELRVTIAKKNEEIETLKSDFEREKKELDNTIKQKKLELEMLRIDYQSAIMTTFHNKSNTIKEHLPSKTPIETGGRKARAAKQKTIEVLKKQAESDQEDQEEEYYNPKDSEEETPEDDEEEEYDSDDFAPKRGKRKATKARQNPDNKRVKKNENKDLILATRNTIQYHLFN